MIDIYVINLKERNDRKEQILKDFSIYKNINLIFIDAIKHEKGSIGCFLSHKKSVQYAKDNNMDYIIVAEDDCLPFENFEEKLIKILEDLQDETWNIFLGGVVKSNKVLYKTKNNFFSIKKGHQAHFIIYNKNIYNTILECDEMKEAIDTFWHGKYLALITLPFIASQRNGFSNIGMKYNGSQIDNIIKTQNFLLDYIKKNNY